MNDCDVIVIGAGLGGISAGALLASPTDLLPIAIPG